MKKTIKKMAIILIISFSVVFVFTPAFAGRRSFNRCCGTTEKWGRGGKWETKDSSASNALWPIVIGALGLSIIIYLFKNGTENKPEPQKVYIYPEKKEGEHGAPLKYNPAARDVIFEESNNSENIAIDANETYEEQEQMINENDDHTNEIF